MQKRNLVFMSGMFVALTFIMCWVSAYAAEFTANMAMSREQGFNLNGIIFVKGKMFRMETVVDGEKVVFIENRETGEGLTLNVSQKKFVEYSGFSHIEKMNEELLNAYDKKKLGKGTVNGYKCDKYIYIDGSRTVAELWVSKKLGWFIKRIVYAKNSKSVSELKDIHEQRIDDALFMIPPGYAKVAPSGSVEKPQDQIKGKKEVGVPDMARQEQVPAKMEGTLQEPAIAKQSADTYASDFDSLIESAVFLHKKGNRLGTVKKLKEALLVIWDKVPFTVSNVRLVNDIKDYVPRTNNIYRNGETIYITCQIFGYKMKKIGEMYNISIKTDMSLLDEKGRVLIDRKNYSNFDNKSNIPNTDFTVNLNYTFTDASKGIYDLKTVIYDANSGKSAQFTKKIEIITEQNK